MPTIVNNRTKSLAQETNKILSEMPHEKRRSIRKLIETLRSDEPIAEYLIMDAGAFSWEKPSFGSKIEIWACGAGGGGGAGRKGAVGSIRRNGNPGGVATPILIGVFDASSISGPITGTIGTGGAGAASVTTNSTTGASGSAGTDTTISLTGGIQSTASGAAGGTSGTNGTLISGSSTTAINVDPSIPFRSGVAAASGSGIGLGGGIGSDNVIVAPGLAYQSPFLSVLATGDDGIAQAPGGKFTYLGAAPRGGNASLTGNAQDGGDGVLGIGGAGGGAAVDDVGDSGAGGRGGDGFVYIAVYP